MNDRCQRIAQQYVNAYSLQCSKLTYCKERISLNSLASSAVADQNEKLDAEVCLPAVMGPGLALGAHFMCATDNMNQITHNRNI